MTATPAAAEEATPVTRSEIEAACNSATTSQGHALVQDALFSAFSLIDLEGVTKHVREAFSYPASSQAHAAHRALLSRLLAQIDAATGSDISACVPESERVAVLEGIRIIGAKPSVSGTAKDGYILLENMPDWLMVKLIREGRDIMPGESDLQKLFDAAVAERLRSELSRLFAA